MSRTTNGMADPDGLDPITARNRLNGLYAKKTPPDFDLVLASRATLACANIAKAIRESMDACPGPLHHAHVEYLIGRIVDAGNKPVATQDGE